ncbi:hypothetical protein DITRI_Ditri13aG0058700 [Diplodiscus trichospermus]
MTNILAQNSIPSIDMSNWEDPQVAKSICDAASEWGFFQIVNHEVPVEVLENVKGATYRFFGLPTKVKNQYSEDHLHLAQVLAFKQRKSLSGKITLACFMSLKKTLLHCGLLSIGYAVAMAFILRIAIHRATTRFEETWNGSRRALGSLPFLTVFLVFRWNPQLEVVYGLVSAIEASLALDAIGDR